MTMCACAMGMRHGACAYTRSSLLDSQVSIDSTVVYLSRASVVVPRVFVLRHGGGKMDQMATVLSLLAEASQREQGEKCTALTVPVWYRSTASGFHLPHCHTRTRRSQPPVTSSLVSGRTQTCGEQVQPWAQHRAAAERTATCACACARARACIV